MMSNFDILSDLDHDFKDLKLTALKAALEMAPYANEVTIGPGSKDPTIIKREVKIEHNNGVPARKPLDRNRWKTRQVEKNIELQRQSLCYDKLLHERELKKKEATENVFQGMLKKMVSRRAEMMTKFWHQQELEYEKRAQERRNREIEILQEWAHEDEMAKMEQEKLDQENRAHSERMKKLLEKQLEATKMFEILNSNHSQICSVYQDILKMPSADKNVHDEIIQKYESHFYSILSSMNIITERCKSGSISPDDVENAKKLTALMCDLKTSISTEIANAISAKESEKLVSEGGVKVKEEPKDDTVDICNESVRNIEEANKKPEGPSLSKYVSDTSLAVYMANKEFLESYEESYQPFVSDASLKRFIFDCRKAVNVPLNLLNSSDKNQCRVQYEKLVKLLNGENVSVGDTTVSASQHPLAKPFCTNLLANKLVDHGGFLVSSNPDLAFPLATVAVALWARFPEFGKLISAQFQKVCPYTVPMMLPKLKDQSDEDFYKSRGYTYKDGKVEEHNKFLKRMAGIFRFFAAIWVVPLPRGMNALHPQGVNFAWRWLAAFVNLEPEIDISATLLLEFLEICSYHFFKYYKLQFIKILHFLMTDYRGRLSVANQQGPVDRLFSFIETIVKAGGVAPPKGLQNDKAW